MITAGLSWALAHQGRCSQLSKGQSTDNPPVWPPKVPLDNCRGTAVLQEGKR